MFLAAALIYWVIVALWAAVLVFVAVAYSRNHRAFGTTRLLLAVVAVDTLRNIFENIYFGLYFGGQYGFFPGDFVTILGRPVLLILPKLLNVVAGSVVLGLLLLRWLPMAVRERRLSNEYADHLEALASLDELTGLFNRRHFESLACIEFARYRRYRRPLSVLMLDVDHFKAVNDRFGHAAGDRVLTALAATCEASKRNTDVVARVGGEEFAILLPETDAQAACAFAERLRQLVRENSLAGESPRLEVTVSIGVAEASSAMAEPDALLEAADRALYEAKRTRNRVCVAGADAAASRVA